MSRSRKRVRSIAEALGLALVAFASARLAVTFLIEPEGMAPFWFANGIMLAVLIRRPPHAWPLLLGASYIGLLANTTLLAMPLFPNAVYALGNVLEPLLVALAVRRFARGFSVVACRDVGILIGSAAVACAVGATIAWSAGPVSWQLWLINDFLGIVLVAPAVLVFWPLSASTALLRARPGASIVAEVALIAAGLTATTILGLMRSSPESALHYSYAVLPFLLWATMRFQVIGATLATLLLAVLTLALTMQGIGPFATAPVVFLDRSLSIQVFLALVLLTHLALGAAVLERTQATVTARQQIAILECVAARKPLPEILAGITQLVESHGNEALCSILLLDAAKGTLHHGAAPSLPAEFTQAIDGMPIGPDAGSCGTAAFRREPVFVEDIATHASWDRFRHLALPHRLAACWSSPIFAPSGEVLGTLAIYYRTPRLPTAGEVRIVEAATHLASIAILRDSQHERLRRSEASVRQLLETAHEGVWIVRLDGATRFANPRMAQILGTSPEAMLGTSLYDWVPPENREEIRRKMQDRVKGVSERHDVRLMHADGHEIWVRVAASPVLGEDGVVEGALGMVTDITAELAASGRIAEQAALLDHARDAILLIDLDHTIRFWNDGATRLYGWSRDEALGLRATELFAEENEELEVASAAVRCDEAWVGEMTHFTKAGKQVTVEARWSLVRETATKAPAVLIINTDVTERKKLEAQVVVTQRMESLGSLAGGIAHDFNNVLTAIVGHLSLARRALPADHAVQAHLCVVQDASARATDLVRQILAFSRKRTPQRAVTRLAPIVEETVRLLRSTLPAMIELRTELGGSAFDVLGDPSQIHQVVMNLATNAAHAIGTRGGSISIRLHPSQVVEKLAVTAGEIPPGRYMVLSVSDDGAGMDEATLKRIFDPFFTTKQPTEGTGLGLSVVLGIVKSHGGGIVVDTRVDRGSSFHVFLPTTAALAVAASAPLGTEDLRGHGERVLVVDDEKTVSLLITTMLDQCGYRVECAADAPSAWATFADHPDDFDAIVTDYAMAGMSGLELVRRMRGLKPAVPIIMLSGYLSPEVSLEADRLGVSRVLSKPGFVTELPLELKRSLAAGDGTHASVVVVRPSPPT